MKFTCQGCPNRTPGCHDKCEKYQAEKAANDEMKAKQHMERYIQGGLTEQRFRAVSKVKSKRRKKNDG